MTDDADPAAKALIAAFRLLADSLPGMHEKQVAPGVISLMSGLPMATLNGVFNIATVPAYRGRGSGRAVTSRIVADGVARGADLAYLQSSEDGYPLYQSMGFRTVETWTYLSSAPGG